MERELSTAVAAIWASGRCFVGVSGQHRGMPPVFIGSEALARGGALTRATLRWNYRRLYPDVYTSAPPASLRVRTIGGAWLWTRRNGIVTGRAAAALHGARWVDDRVPIEMIWKCGRPRRGVIARNERIAADEVTQIAGLLVTTPPNEQRWTSPGICRGTGPLAISMPSPPRRRR